jgi:prepilin-type processing-associated H-X9-DG protein
MVALVALLLPLIPKAHRDYGGVRSQNNLHWIALALHNYAGTNNQQLPSASVNNAPFFFSGPKGLKGTPAYDGGLLSFMEGDTKQLQAPLDVNLDSADGAACSYSIPQYWSTFNDGTGNIWLPDSFPRGTAQCIGAAEMTTYGRTYASIQPFEDRCFEPALANTASTTANSFYSSGGSRCNVAMMDGSVRVISLAAGYAGDFRLACHPDDVTTDFSSHW